MSHRPRRPSAAAHQDSSDDEFRPSSSSALPAPRRRAQTTSTPAAANMAQGEPSNVGGGIQDAEVLKALPAPVKQYTLRPTVPSPFSPDIEVTLDALLGFKQVKPGLDKLLDAILEVTDRERDWMALIDSLLPDHRRDLTDLLLFLTRVAFLNEIARNRDLLKQLYSAHNGVSAMLRLRYDVYSKYEKEQGRAIVIDNNDAEFTIEGTVRPITDFHSDAAPGKAQEDFAFYPALMPNMLSTLVHGTRPAGDYRHNVVRKKMMHHASYIDGLIVITDEEAQGLSTLRFRVRLADVILQWHELRAINNVLERMSNDDPAWRQLLAPAAESEWVW